ncbi:arf-GAP with SH3 domain, ANK repeat and PH domain-containing protein 1-like, partial [Ruditapes philippinarum]
MPEAISVADIIEQTWEDYKSPTTSTFDKKMTKCRNSVAQLEEELDTDRSELTKLKKSVRALYNSTNKHAQNEKDIAENLERISNSTCNSYTQINS